jgi:hypothetical protein
MFRTWKLSPVAAGIMPGHRSLDSSSLYRREYCNRSQGSICLLLDPGIMRLTIPSENRVT